MGLATCDRLRRRGLRVLGIDRFPIPHQQGSHHGHSRMIRMSYFEHSDYVPLLRRAFQLWRELEEELGKKLLLETGGLYLGAKEGVIVNSCARAAAEHSLSHEMLSATEVLQRYPIFAGLDEYRGYYEREGGVLLVDSMMRELRLMVGKGGVEFREGESVIEWRADAGGVSVRTDLGAYSADRLILAGGAWSGELLHELGVPLQVTRQTMFWVQPRANFKGERDSFPAWFLETEPGRGIYGFPELPGKLGFKVAEHLPGESTSPSTVDRQVNAADWTRLRSIAQEHIPDLLGEVVDSSVCLYTNTPDGHFVLDRHPRFRNVTFAAGFSGHGFKFAPVIGEALADLALLGSTSLPVGFLGLDRFA